MRQEINRFEALNLEDGSGSLAGHAFVARSQDKFAGSRELDLEIRPVLLGMVAVRVSVSSQGVEATRSTKKSAELRMAPEALRGLAAHLLEAADAADALKLKPRPAD